MSRYIAKPSPPKIRTVHKGGWHMDYGNDEGETARTAHVEDRSPMEDTGLLDADGNRLYREREPIGFKVR